MKERNWENDLSTCNTDMREETCKGKDIHTDRKHARTEANRTDTHTHKHRYWRFVASHHT